jgi:hypothetical protein
VGSVLASCFFAEGVDNVFYVLYGDVEAVGYFFVGKAFT